MKYGKPPEERTVEELIEKGLIVLDKPMGPTAHEIVAWIKKILNIKKAGQESGTLGNVRSSCYGCVACSNAKGHKSLEVNARIR